MMELAVTTGAIRRAKLQSNSHFSALTLLAGQQEEHWPHKETQCWYMNIKRRHVHTYVSTIYQSVFMYTEVEDMIWPLSVCLSV